MGGSDDWESTENDYLKLAHEVSKARVEYAKEWQWQRRKTNSDLAATQATIEITKDKLGLLTAQMKVLEWRLQR